MTEEVGMTKLRVLLGDDQIGIEGSLYHRSFLRSYGHLADFEFSYNPEDFIKRAHEKKYDALITDLNWTEEELSKKEKTGFRILEAIRDCAPIRVLHTSDDTYMKMGFEHGATHCLEKNRSARLLEEILKGGERE